MPEDFQPSAEYIISDLETLKVISDSLRIRILEAMGDKPTTVKQVAQKLDMSPKKLYYHVNLLEEHGLIVVVDTQVVSGIIEKWYQIRASSFVVDKSMLTLIEDRDEQFESLRGLLSGIFEVTLEDVALAARQGEIRRISDDPKLGAPFFASNSTLQMTEEQRQSFMERLYALVQECRREDEQDPSLGTFGLTMVFYPKVTSPVTEYNEEESDE